MTSSLRTRDISETLYGYNGDLKRAVEIADHYGFRLMHPLRIEKDDREHADKYGYPHEHAALMRLMMHDDRYRGRDAVLIAHTRKVPYKNKLELRLEVLGDRESSAEALLLQTTKAILHEYGHNDLLVAVNSVGGRESTTSFSQAMHNFVRNRLSELHADCRDGIRQSVFAPLRCDHEACRAVRNEAPQSLNYLSEQSKQHFKEVLEYIESFDLPYVIDPSLVGNEHYTTRTVFSIGTPASGTDSQTGHFERTLAYGERYDQLAKKLGAKKAIPATHVTIDLGTKTVKESFVPITKQAQPNAYVVHVGMPAKIRTLLMNESLRKSHIRVTVTLHKKSVTEQMDHAKALGAPLILIIGHKEVHDGTVLIRHVATNKQNTVNFSELPSYLRTVKIDR